MVTHVQAAVMSGTGIFFVLTAVNVMCSIYCLPALINFFSRMTIPKPLI